MTPGRKPEPRQVLGILDQLLAPMGRDDAIKPLLKTARRQNVAQQYDAYERALQNAHQKTAYEEREMVRVRDEDRRRQAARVAAHHTLELENAQNVLLQADEARARKALDKVSEPWTMAEATKAFPFLNYVPDHIGKRKKAEGYGAELEKQVRSAEEHQRKAKAHERAADARALATSMALVARDREARRLISEAAHGELAADWRRSMDLTELKKGVTKNGSLIQGH